MHVNPESLMMILAALDYAQKTLGQNKPSMEDQAYAGAKCINAMLRLQTELGIVNNDITGHAPKPTDTFKPGLKLETLEAAPTYKKEELGLIPWELVS